MRLEAVIERVWRYTWSSWSSEVQDALQDGDRARLAMHLHAMPVLTGRQQLSEFGDTLGGRDRASLGMHLEAMIVLPCGLKSSEFGDAAGGHGCAHLEAVIERVERCTWRPWLNEWGDALGRPDWVRLDGYLEAVDGQCAGCWDHIHRFVNSHPWDCDNVKLPLNSHQERADGGRLCREICRKLKLHSGVNS